MKYSEEEKQNLLDKQAQEILDIIIGDEDYLKNCFNTLLYFVSEVVAETKDPDLVQDRMEPIRDIRWLLEECSKYQTLHRKLYPDFNPS